MAPGGMARLIVEAGFAAAAPGLSAGYLILDDPVAGRLDTGTLADDDMFEDISQWGQQHVITRGSTREQGPVIVYEGGTSASVFGNSDARFSPDNLAGPYVAAGVSRVRPMIPLRYRAQWAGVTYPLMRCFAQSFDPGEDQGPDYATTTVTGADGFLVLAGAALPATGAVGAGELSGARVTRILNAAGWYDAARGMSAVSAGNSAVQATTFGATALELLQLTAASEIGALYVDASGRLTFRSRHDVLTSPRSTTVQAVFGDRPGTVHPGGTELYYSAVTRPATDLSLANDIQATRAGGALQEVKDAASIARYLFARTYSRSDLILTSDTETLNWAQYVAWITAAGTPEFDAITTIPAADPDNLWPVVLGLEIGDRIQVWRRPPGMASPVTRDCLVRGVSHTVGAGTWEVTLSLQDASRYSFFTLDDPVLGRLDSNALAFLRRTMDTRPHTPAEIDRWGYQRRPHEREKPPEIGERVLLREEDFAEPVPAIVICVQDMTIPGDHWRQHGQLTERLGAGLPDPSVWAFDQAAGRHRLHHDPWPWVHVQVITGYGDDGQPLLAPARWCKEARVRGSTGWLREGSRAHAYRYEEG